MVKINDVISKEIEESKIDKPLKEFLNKMLYFQLMSISEGSGRWKFGRDFDNMIIEYTAKRRGSKNAD
ncbi:MAG: hypothetical protein NT129_00785 [Candidatus Aenigmarchaeota archaeon]|nr:hypothetical protein [Candidatus Aenigmarchaeota archaeon]